MGNSIDGIGAGAHELGTRLAYAELLMKGGAGPFIPRAEAPLRASAGPSDDARPPHTATRDPASRVDKLPLPQSGTTHLRNAISAKLGEQGIYIGNAPTDAQIRTGVAKAASMLIQKNGDLGGFLKEVAALAPGQNFGSELIKSANAAPTAARSGLSPAAKNLSAGIIVAALTRQSAPTDDDLSQSELKAAYSFADKFTKQASTQVLIPEYVTTRDAVVEQLRAMSGDDPEALARFFESLPVVAADPTRPRGPVDARARLGVPGLTANAEKFLVYGLVQGMAGAPANQPPVRLNDAERQAVDKVSKGVMKALEERQVAPEYRGVVDAVAGALRTIPKSDPDVIRFLDHVLARF